jgi:hypothetical protein
MQPGEVVTTGTLTAACGVQPGQVWRMQPAAIALEGVALSLR